MIPRWLFASLVLLEAVVNCYQLTPCTRERQAQFQFPDCYIPPMRTDLPLAQASFVMSHDAATGYIQPNSLRPSSTVSTSSSSWSWWYSKNQVGSVYQQLQDGARALDLRPYLYTNGTIAFHHGIIRIPVAFVDVISDVVQWCQEHEDELVLLLLSHFAYEYYDGSSSMVSAVANVLNDLGVAYVDCTAVYDMTVAQVMDLAALVTNDAGRSGHVLVLDGHDTYGTSCAKENWVESQIVTCYPKQSTSCLASDHTNDLFVTQLQPYLLASANNAATDDTSTLGPPLDVYHTPLNEIQALWQVTASSALIGLEHFSSILHDNVQSHVNARVMDLVYQEEFVSLSLLAMDNVATNGNAVLSVVRTQCGQFQNDADTLCGQQLPRPPLVHRSFFSLTVMALVLMVLYVAWFCYSVVHHQRPKLLYTAWSRWRAASVPRTDPAGARRQGLLS